MGSPAQQMKRTADWAGTALDLITLRPPPPALSVREYDGLLVEVGRPTLILPRRPGEESERAAAAFCIRDSVGGPATGAGHRSSDVPNHVQRIQRVVGRSMTLIATLVESR